MKDKEYEFLGKDKALMKSRINIYMPADKNYLKYCWVAIASLFRVNQNCDIYVYIVSEDIEEDDMIYLRKLEKEYQQHIVLIQFNAEEAREKAGLKAVGRWPIGLYSCYWLFHYLLPEEVDRIMTIEADTVSVASIEKIYNIDLEDMYAASQGPEHSPKRHLKVSNDMGGDFLSYNLSIYNVKKIREEIEFSTILEKDREAHRALGYSQQEWTLGLLFKGKIKYFSAATACLHENCKSIEELGIKYIIEAEKKCALLHFPSYADNAKPWNPVYIMPGFIQWWDVARNSPYFEEYFLNQHLMYEKKCKEAEALKKNISYLNISICTYVVMLLILEIYYIGFKQNYQEAVFSIVSLASAFIIAVIIRKCWIAIRTKIKK